MADKTSCGDNGDDVDDKGSGEQKRRGDSSSRSHVMPAVDISILIKFHMTTILEVSALWVVLYQLFLHPYRFYITKSVLGNVFVTIRNHTLDIG